MTVSRPRALLLCYACKPDAGSEEGVGWTWAASATEVAAVTVLTTPLAADEVRDVARQRRLAMEVVAVDPGRWLRPIATVRWLGYLYYLAWQRSAARAVRRLERSGPFDVVHHVTWASDSLPSALLASARADTGVGSGRRFDAHASRPLPLPLVVGEG